MLILLRSLHNFITVFNYAYLDSVQLLTYLQGTHFFYSLGNTANRMTIIIISDCNYAAVFIINFEVSFGGFLPPNLFLGSSGIGNWMFLPKIRFLFLQQLLIMPRLGDAAVSRSCWWWWALATRPPPFAKSVKLERRGLLAGGLRTWSSA